MLTSGIYWFTYTKSHSQVHAICPYFQNPVEMAVVVKPVLLLKHLMLLGFSSQDPLIEGLQACK